ncbi:MAG: hypothetical protein RR490_10575, partial [Niameybacter sp.]
MNTLKYITVWLFIAIIVSCQSKSDGLLLLSRAASFMEVHPDSALLLLKQISNWKDLSVSEKARYGLLITQALDKNELPLASDSLIRLSVDYYETQADLLNKGKAFFYWGRFY